MSVVLIEGVSVPSIRVAEAELEQLFESLAIWQKADTGRLESIEEPSTRSPARFCEDGQSYFIRLHNAAGLNVARVHYISCADGRVLRWPSALLIGGLTRYRIGHD
jgi:hypothetical protein